MAISRAQLLKELLPGLNALLVSNTLSMVTRLLKSSSLNLRIVLLKKKLSCPVSVPHLLRVKVLRSNMTTHKKRGLLVTLTRRSQWAFR